MLAWKQERQGKSALLIKGARRIGKSTIVRTFAEREYKSYIDRFLQGIKGCYKTL